MTIMWMNSLLCETIGSRVNVDRLGLLSTLEILKVKSKPTPKLS